MQTNNNYNNFSPKAQKDTELSARRREFFLSKRAESEACLPLFVKPKHDDEETVRCINQRDRKNLSTRKERTVVRLRKTSSKREVCHVKRTTFAHRGESSIVVFSAENNAMDSSSCISNEPIDFERLSFHEYNNGDVRITASSVSRKNDTRRRAAGRRGSIQQVAALPKPECRRARSTSIVAPVPQLHSRRPRRLSTVASSAKETLDGATVPILSCKFSLKW